MRKLLKISGIILLVIIAIIFLLGLIPDDNTIQSGVIGKYIEVNGAKIRYYQTGNGPDVLLIHGLPGMIEVFNPIINDLSSSCRITVFDRPAHGYSDAKNDKYTIEYNADIALNLIKKLGLKKVVVVGHSYGCSVAMAMAINDETNIKSLVLLGSPCMFYKEDNKPSILGNILVTPIIGRSFAFVVGKTIGKKSINKTLDDAIYPSDINLIADIKKQALKLWLTPKVLVAYAKEKKSSPSSKKKLQEEFKNIKIKVNFIHGIEDRLVPLKYSVDASKLIMNSSLMLLDGVGHFPQYSVPKKISSIIINESKQ